MSNASKKRTKKLSIQYTTYTSGGSRIPATSKMDIFVIIVKGWKSLTDVTESSTLGVAAFLHPLLHTAVLSS